MTKPIHLKCRQFRVQITAITFLFLLAIFFAAGSFASPAGRLRTEWSAATKREREFGQRKYSNVSVLTQAAQAGPGWSIVTAAAPARVDEYKIYNVVLFGVTCNSASDCWSVGRSENGSSFPTTLIQRWDGSAWTLVNSPNTDSGNDTLFGVTCVSSADCWAVGNGAFSSEVNDPGYDALSEHWNGISWQIVPAPNAVGINFLESVSCSSSSNCWTVGYHQFDTADGKTVRQTLAEHWDGVAWTVVASPNTSTTKSNALYSIACPSPSQCWAVGNYIDPNIDNGASQTLIEHWDGSTWSIVPSSNLNPGTGPHGDVLNAVACISSSDCWAVGEYDGQNIHEPLTQHWNGSAWTIVAAPNSNNGGDNLSGVTCRSTSDCWAVGQSYVKTLIQHWDGTSWQLAPSPNKNTDNQLRSVVCPSQFDCWAVGSDANNVLTEPLIEKYASTVPALSRVVSAKTQGSTTFNIDLPLIGAAGVDCRSGSASGDFTLIFSFVNELSSVESISIASGVGQFSNGSLGPNPNQYTAHLTQVANGQYLIVSLNNVQDVAGNTGTVSSTVGVLAGDTNGDGSVNSADIAQTKSQSGQRVSALNFREDVTCDGDINSADIAFVKSKSGTALP